MPRCHEDTAEDDFREWRPCYSLAMGDDQSYDIVCQVCSGVARKRYRGGGGPAQPSPKRLRGYSEADWAEEVAALKQDLVHHRQLGIEERDLRKEAEKVLGLARASKKLSELKGRTLPARPSLRHV